MKILARLLLLLSTVLLAGSGEFNCSSSSGSGSSGNTNASGKGSDSKIRVASSQKISENNGGFGGGLQGGDAFGSAVADLGDLEGDGVTDLGVGAPFDDDDGNDKGSTWVLFMDADGKVDTKQKISANDGSFGGDLKGEDAFGSAVAALGDLNGDGFFDMAVGAPGNDNGGDKRGGLWILFLDAQGKVSAQQEIADGEGGLGGGLDDNDRFGSAVTALGDLNGDGITELAVGAPNTDDGADNAGAVWILFMTMEGKVDTKQKISNNGGGLGNALDNNDQFGSAVAGIGDLDRDGNPDLAVGAPGADGDRGVVWILFLDATGKVRDKQQITDGTGGFNGTLSANDRFGSAVAAIGDMDADGIRDIAAGAPNDDDGASNAGAVWILLMGTDGKVDDWQKISDTQGGFGGDLDADDNFGAAISGIGNLDGRAREDLAVGSPGDDSGGTDKGALWILFMEDRN